MYHSRLTFEQLLHIKKQQNKIIYEKKTNIKNPSPVKESIIDIDIKKPTLDIKKPTLDIKKQNNSIIIEKSKIITDDQPELIIKTQFEYINKIKLIKNHNQIINYLNSLPIIRHFNNTHTCSDNVSLIEGYIVKKKCNNNSLGNFMFWNEVNVLKKVKSFPHFPHLISFDHNTLTIYMTYCGPILNNNNIPDNWEIQFNEISEIMNVLNVNSNDMISRNICCLGNEIKIIDFGLNTIFGRTIKEVLNDFYRDLKNMSHKIPRIVNNNNYDYNNYYPNWKNNLKKIEMIKKNIEEYKNKTKNNKKK